MNSSSPSLTSKRWKWRRLLTTTGWQTLKRPTLYMRLSQLAQPPLSFTGLQRGWHHLAKRSGRLAPVWSHFWHSLCSNRQLPTHQIRRWQELAEITGVNLEEINLALLKVGTNLASKSAEELIDIDAKTFELNGNDVRVAQVNTVDINEVWNVRKKLKRLFGSISKKWLLRLCPHDYRHCELQLWKSWPLAPIWTR